MALVLQSVAEIWRCRYAIMLYYMLYYVIVKRGKKTYALVVRTIDIKCY